MELVEQPVYLFLEEGPYLGQDRFERVLVLNLERFYQGGHIMLQRFYHFLRLLKVTFLLLLLLCDVLLGFANLLVGADELLVRNCQ